MLVNVVMKRVHSDKKEEKKEKPVIERCPKCGIKLILNGPGWGFCDNCCIEITE